jgi:hypothetical protein
LLLGTLDYTDGVFDLLGNLDPLSSVSSGLLLVFTGVGFAEAAGVTVLLFELLAFYYNYTST